LVTVQGYHIRVIFNWLGDPYEEHIIVLKNISRLHILEKYGRLLGAPYTMYKGTISCGIGHYLGLKINVKSAPPLPLSVSPSREIRSRTIYPAKNVPGFSAHVPGLNLP